MKSYIPDVNQNPELSGTLDWAGMSSMEIPVRVAGQKLAARVDAMVDLVDPKSRGIHMSRIYQVLAQGLTEADLSWEGLNALLQQMVEGQQGLSTRAQLEIRFEIFAQRKALKSDRSGWRQYPAGIKARVHEGRLRIHQWTEVLYSSTCPFSTKLSQQVQMQQFEKDFPQDTSIDRGQLMEWFQQGRGMPATPHAQRSVGRIDWEVSGELSDWLQMIDAIEQVLQTPVQTAVKRADEQEFAKLNAQNQMFCEDAARRLQQLLKGHSEVEAFQVRVEHIESLHPHNAVAIVTG